VFKGNENGIQWLIELLTPLEGYFVPLAPKLGSLVLSLTKTERRLHLDELFLWGAVRGDIPRDCLSGSPSPGGGRLSYSESEGSPQHNKGTHYGERRK